MLQYSGWPPDGSQEQQGANSLVLSLGTEMFQCISFPGQRAQLFAPVLALPLLGADLHQKAGRAALSVCHIRVLGFGLSLRIELASEDKHEKSIVKMKGRPKDPKDPKPT